ncbi:MAG: hypothetical protein SFY32_01640 [Bacteroidota bacterium]|nr:hypothetical protein [Bacteroidota bacterium]
MNTLTKVLIPLVIIETGAIIFLITQLNDKSNEVKQLTEVVSNKDQEVIDKTKELENISAEFERVKAEREKLGLANDSLDVQLTQLNTAITQLKRSKSIDANKRKELEQMVSKLREEITKRDQEIVVLKSQNDSLTTNVNQLSSEKAKLSDSISSVSSKRQDLEGKLAYARILKAENFKIVVVKENNKEIEDDKNEFKASKIHRIKVVYSLADNKAAEQSDKEFYLRMVTPNGETFSDPSNGGGNITLADGSTIAFTTKQTIKFDNSNQSITFTTIGGIKYVPGSYTLEIYCEGYKIGSSKFTAK